MKSENVTTSETEAAKAVEDAPPVGDGSGGDSSHVIFETPTGRQRRNTTRPMWQYAAALVVTMGAIMAAVSSYQQAVHSNESWGGKADPNVPVVDLDEQIAKVKNDKTLSETARAKMLAGLQYAKSMEASHRH